MTTLPRGIRNNNPGNVRKTQDAWVGETASDDIAKAGAVIQEGVGVVEGLAPQA